MDTTAGGGRRLQRWRMKVRCHYCFALCLSGVGHHTHYQEVIGVAKGSSQSCDNSRQVVFEDSLFEAKASDQKQPQI